MDWDNIQDTLSAVVASVVPESTVRWETYEGTSGWASAGSSVELSLVSVRRLGRDELRQAVVGLSLPGTALLTRSGEEITDRANDPVVSRDITSTPGQPLTDRTGDSLTDRLMSVLTSRAVPLAGQLGFRVFGNRRLTVQLKVERRSFSALNDADRLLTLIGSCPEIHSTLATACLAASDIRLIDSRDYCNCDGQKVSAAILEMTFNTTTSIDCAAVDYVAKITTMGTVLDSSGSVVATPTIVSEAS